MVNTNKQPARLESLLNNTELTNTISRNIIKVRKRISRAIKRAGRDSSKVRLIGVSKTFPKDYVIAATAAGVTNFGENRIQEGLNKASQIENKTNITWHFVGHLQSNKARKAVSAFTWIHSVDSLELLHRLEHAADEQKTSTKILVQVNLANEINKHGASIDETIQILHAGKMCHAVKICGLMILPPWSIDPEQSRPYFRQLHELRNSFLDKGFEPQMLSELSMGMSRDFDIAIEEGATIIRIGTAIFGHRQQKNIDTLLTER